TFAGAGPRVDSVVPVWAPVPVGSGLAVTVTAAPTPGLPDGADPAPYAGFATVRIPIRADGGYGPVGLPNMTLIGSGIGRATLDAECAGSPTGFPDRFDTPRDGVVCFVLPDGFTPLYLVFFNDSVAVDLTAPR
ncbi:MAG: hypothetical protein H7Y15_14425, partial [Pseudonocardia sp.]|nr:hypothetical protein [Pseudonocardia sp.]